MVYKNLSRKRVKQKDLQTNRHSWLGENSLKYTDGEKKVKQKESRYKVISQANERRKKKGKEEQNEMSLKMQEKERRKGGSELKERKKSNVQMLRKEKLLVSRILCNVFRVSKSGENVSPAWNFFLNDENLVTCLFLN